MHMLKEIMFIYRVCMLLPAMYTCMQFIYLFFDQGVVCICRSVVSLTSRGFPVARQRVRGRSNPSPSQTAMFMIGTKILKLLTIPNLVSSSS